jgi:hypothetical protein
LDKHQNPKQNTHGESQGILVDRLEPVPNTLSEQVIEDEPMAAMTTDDTEIACTVLESTVRELIVRRAAFPATADPRRKTTSVINVARRSTTDVRVRRPRDSRLAKRFSSGLTKNGDAAPQHLHQQPTCGDRHTEHATAPTSRHTTIPHRAT